MRSEPSDVRSDGSEVCITVLRTPLHSIIPQLIFFRDVTYTALHSYTIFYVGFILSPTKIQKNTYKF
ncbi:hypothetical protein RHMOL_Rhmol13G0256200 [Rhododendron molle]|nr:hypothetical protein RHMOL_Rhmol13G0256200 [Rhododendron molle]